MSMYADDIKRARCGCPVGQRPQYNSDNISSTDAAAFASNNVPVHFPSVPLNRAHLQAVEQRQPVCPYAYPSTTLEIDSTNTEEGNDGRFRPTNMTCSMELTPGSGLNLNGTLQHMYAQNEEHERRQSFSMQAYQHDQHCPVPTHGLRPHAIPSEPWPVDLGPANYQAPTEEITGTRVATRHGGSSRRTSRSGNIGSPSHSSRTESASQSQILGYAGSQFGDFTLHDNLGDDMSISVGEDQIEEEIFPYVYQ